MHHTYTVRSYSEKGQMYWLIESAASGQKLMFFSSKEQALLRCDQLMQLSRGSQNMQGSSTPFIKKSFGLDTNFAIK